jgi:mercuric ion binding protein
MKHFVKFMALAAVCALFTCGTASAQNAKSTTSKKANANLTEVTFDTDIHCQNCVKKIESKLPYEKGVKDMKCNVDDKTVWIQYDSRKTSPEKLAAAIKKCGYSATVKTGAGKKECTGECKNAEGKKECTGECKNAEGKKECTGECKNAEGKKECTGECKNAEGKKECTGECKKNGTEKKK